MLSASARAVSAIERARSGEESASAQASLLSSSILPAEGFIDRDYSKFETLAILGPMVGIRGVEVLEGFLRDVLGVLVPYRVQLRLHDSGRRGALDVAHELPEYR